MTINTSTEMIRLAEMLAERLVDEDFDDCNFRN
jgi:hypothetical protein